MPFLECFLAQGAQLSVGSHDFEDSPLSTWVPHYTPYNEAKHHTDVSEKHGDGKVAKIEVLFLFEYVPNVKQVDEAEKVKLTERLEPPIASWNVWVDNVGNQEEPDWGYCSQISLNGIFFSPLLHD